MELEQNGEYKLPFRVLSERELERLKSQINRNPHYKNVKKQLGYQGTRHRERIELYGDHPLFTERC